MPTCMPVMIKGFKHQHVANATLYLYVSINLLKEQHTQLKSSTNRGCYIVPSRYEISLPVLQAAMLCSINYKKYRAFR